MKKLLLLLCIVGCGDGAYTWGEAVEEVLGKYCQTAHECGFIDERSVAECVRTNKFYMCEHGDTCGRELAQGAEEVVQQCVTSLEPTSDVCSGVYWGVVPPQCADFFDLRPM